MPWSTIRGTDDVHVVHIYVTHVQHSPASRFRGEPNETAVQSNLECSDIVSYVYIIFTLDTPTRPLQSPAKAQLHSGAPSLGDWGINESEQRTKYFIIHAVMRTNSMTSVANC